MLRLITITILLLLSPTALAVDPVPTLVAEASTAFAKGDYDTAIARYEDAVASGHVNGHLYYNLGIAYFRKAKTGDALAAFLAARRYLPRDPDVRANIRFVTASIRDKLDADAPGGTFHALAFWVRRTTPREVGVAFAVMAFLAAAFLAATVVIPAARPARGWALGSLVIPALLAAALAISVEGDEVWGAVAKPTAQVYSGPDKNTLVFELQEGAPFKTFARSDAGFWGIELSDGKKGWVAAADVRVF
jgi:tetratricopeptide (TPR) repeat protein